MSVHRQAWQGWIFVAFPLAVLLLFTALPTVLGAGLSFFEWTGGGEPRFVGLANFRQAVHDPTLWNSLRNAVVFALITVPLTILLAFPLAVALHAPWFVGRTTLRTVFFLPTVISIVAIGFIWRWVLESSSAGLLNVTLTEIANLPRSLCEGLGEALNAIAVRLHVPIPLLLPARVHPDCPMWLGNSLWGLAMVVAVSVWRGLGFAVVLYLAAIGNVPQAQVEAAAVDGAGPWQIMWRITWPTVRPMTFFLLVTGMIGALQVFDIVLVMIGTIEQPGTDVLNLYLYREFTRSRLGYAATIGVIVLLATTVVTALQFTWRRGDAEVGA